MIASALVVLGSLASMLAVAPLEEDAMVIIDFAQGVTALPVNDTVMGGVSHSRFETASGVGVFSGQLSLENNGGFASMRFANPRPDLSGVEALVLSFRGDGRTYQLRLRDDRRLDGVAWQATFSTTAGRWQEVELPLESFLPTFRGRRVRDAEPLRADRIQQISVMLADKQPGDFRLELRELRGILRR